MIGEILLTLNEVAELEDKSYSGIKKDIGRGKLKAIKIDTNVKCGFEYRVSLDELSNAAKTKYFARIKDNTETDITDVVKKDVKSYSLEDLTKQQRENAYFWEDVLKQYKEYITGCFKNKTEMTNEFVEIFNSKNEMQISVRNLYEKNKLYKEYGVAALADGRMSRDKKGRKIDDKVWSVFLQWWLDENQPTTSYIYDVTKKWSNKYMPDVYIPSENTFRRAISEIPNPVVKYFREGNKAFEDGCMPYIVRTYEHIESNEFWSSDYHTLDFMVKDDITGEVYRPYLVVWIDIRSRKMLNIRLRKSADSDGVILSFREAALKWGLPSNVYLDNGREFLVHDFGGRGKRKTDKNADYGTPILERVGVTMVNAIVKNSKAKVVERCFKQVTSEFAKLFITYCGNRPGNRPERHNDVLKNKDNIPLASEVLEDIKNYIEGWYNLRHSNAEGLKGLTPNECYANNLFKKRVITEDQANMLLLRSERKQSVERNGVYVTIGDKKVYFYDAEFVSTYQKMKVFVRFDPDELSSARVYDENEKFICVLDRVIEGGYEGAENTEAMKKINSDKKKVRKAVKDFMGMKKDIMSVPDLREVVMEISRDNIINDRTNYDVDILEGNFTFNEEPLKKVAGESADPIDFNKMIKNAKKRKGEN